MIFAAVEQTVTKGKHDFADRRIRHPCYYYGILSRALLFEHVTTKERPLLRQEPQ